MHVTFNYSFFFKRKARFIHVKPTPYYLNWYIGSYTVIPMCNHHKLPRIKRRSLVQLL